MHRLPVVFCVDRAGITGPDGPSHHGVHDMALLSRVPGMRVLAPSSAQELHQMLHDAMSLADEGPVAIRYPRGRRDRWASTMSVSASGLAASAAADGWRRVCACWPSASSSPPPRRRPGCSPRRPRANGVGRALLQAARRRDDRRRGAPSRRRHDRGRHPRGRHRDGDRRPHRCDRAAGAGRGVGSPDRASSRTPTDPRRSSAASGSTPRASSRPCAGSI